MLLKQVKTTLLLWLHGNDSILRATIFWQLQAYLTNITNAIQLGGGGLSGVCAKLEAASSKNNEIFEINVQQKFTPHALPQLTYKFFMTSRF